MKWWLELSLHISKKNNGSKRFRSNGNFPAIVDQIGTAQSLHVADFSCSNGLLVDLQGRKDLGVKVIFQSWWTR